MVTILQLIESKHPNNDAEDFYNQLIGIDEHKDELLNTLTFLLEPNQIKTWQKHHHKKGLQILKQLEAGCPLIILSGEVGCGKTALAQTIGTPLGKKMDTHVKVFETPSNIRGGGMVGELSNRITEAFQLAKS